jgi:hypothetical protein
MDTPPLLKRLLRVSKAHGLLHGIRAGSLNNDGHFPPYVEHVSHEKGRVKASHIAKKYMTLGFYKLWTPFLS